MKINKTINFFLAVLSLMIFCAVIAVTFYSPPSHPVIGSLKTSYAHPLYPANFDNNSILVGASQNVFVGKVVAQMGNSELAGSPTTQFSVEVLKNIKGELKDTATVTQLAGYRDNVLYIMDEDNKLLEVGSTYLFATRYNPLDDTHTLNSHQNASKLLSSDSSKNAAGLIVLADQDEKVKTLEAAYPEEKLLDADIAHNNTRNEFKSLDAKSKAAAQSRADAAKASLATKSL